MKKILFVTLGHLSAGEFTIAFEFCKGLSKEEFDVCFLTSSKGARYLEESKIKHVVLEQSLGLSNTDDKIRNKKITDGLMKEFRPDYVIASDIYTLWYSYTWTGLNLEVFKDYGIPLGSFDSYEFASTNFVQDYYGGYKATIPEYINQCDFVIRYCPINKVQEADKKVKFTYLYGQKITITKEQRREFNNTFKAKGEKVIFIANSNWETLNVNRLPALTNLLYWIPHILINYIAHLDEKVNIIHVGPKRWDDIELNKNIQYHHFKFMKPHEFDMFLSASDILLTTNIISSTLAKSVYATVPAIVFQNDKLINFTKLSEQLKKMPSWYQNMANGVKIAYPFRLFPFGWYSFLETLLNNNEYTDTFIQTSIFHTNKTINTLRSHLYDKDVYTSLQHKQSLYVDRITKLPSPKEVIESLEDL